MRGRHVGASWQRHFRHKRQSYHGSFERQWKGTLDEASTPTSTNAVPNRVLPNLHHLSLYISNIGHSLLTLHYWFSFAGTRIWGRRETIQEKRKEIERGRKREVWGWEGKRERREWWQTTSSGRTQTSLTPPDAVRYSLSTLKSKTSSALTLSLSSRFFFFSFSFYFYFLSDLAKCGSIHRSRSWKSAFMFVASALVELYSEIGLFVSFFLYIHSLGSANAGLYDTIYHWMMQK